MIRSLLAAALCLLLAACNKADAAVPGAEWPQLAPAQSGWSESKLAPAKARAEEIGSSAFLVVQHDAIVAAWGDTGADLLLNSMRKSLLSALIGMAVAEGRIDLDTTLAQLGIDDTEPALTPEEKQATIHDLIEARSGIYHGANYETPEMAANRPARGSHPPGSFWYYNNWDFNALGAIYEQAEGAPVFDAFDRRIARPIGMQDFDPAHCRYAGGRDSKYPAYLFHASARDLARFGLLYLHHGRWGDRQLIPESWIAESTKPYSTTNAGLGYGYLWWRPQNNSALPPDSYFAWGHGGQFLFVIPSRDMVVVHLARERTGQDELGYRRVSGLLGLILAAAPEEPAVTPR